MANYEKPVIIDTEEHYEGVYAASGDNTDSGVSAPKCDSKYMNGVWHAPDYNNTTSYIQRFGCNGCPAFRYNGCGLQLEKYWGSYDVDNGSRYPNWERIGRQPYDAIAWGGVGKC